jgi:XrtN system VIT domain protein
MNNLKAILNEDRIIKTGLIFILVSAALFVIPEFDLFALQEGTAFGIFCCHYLLSVVYFFVIIFSKPKLPAYWTLLFILWFISAFALNRSMNVFDNSVPWLCVVICISCTALIMAAVFMDHLNNATKHLVLFFLGIAFVLFAYYSLYLTSMYVIGIVAAIAIGISLHVFAPVFLAISTFKIISRNVAQSRSLTMALAAGAAVPVVACALFTWQWCSINKQVNLAVNHNTLAEGKLPSWMVISQNIPKNAIAERIIKAGLVYKTANLQDNWFWGDFHTASFDEPMKHDPMVVVASLFAGQTNLAEHERIKILEAMYNSRHQAQERLWSGDKLKTTLVATNIKIFPEYRMAYTEKTLEVKNYETREWLNNQEAIYTFHLPEGSVISSLSLWIDGREAKSRLTTKAKADSAYKTVVGVEMHDPSVVHWQEGNTVSARIFPCTTTENRKFRIGVTSPLKKDGDQLTYESIYFDGPPAGNADESIQVSFSKKPTSLSIHGFEELNEGVFTADRKYRPDEEFSFPAPPLADVPFTFSGIGYKLQDYKPRTEAFDPQRVYLDLNNSWTATEMDEVWNAVKTKKVYYYDGELKKLTEENKAEVFVRAQKLNFSLFPINEIKDAEKALLVNQMCRYITQPGRPGEIGISASAYRLPCSCKALANVQYRHSAYSLFKSLKRDAGV